jgi:hypothetical protein
VIFSLIVLMQAYAVRVLWADETKEVRQEAFTDVIFKALKAGDKALLSKATPSKEDFLAMLNKEPGVQKLKDDPDFQKLQGSDVLKDFLAQKEDAYAARHVAKFEQRLAESFDEVVARIKKRGIELAETELIGFFTKDGIPEKDLLEESSIEVVIVMRYKTTYFTVLIQECTVFAGKRKTIGRLLDKGNMSEERIQKLRAIGIEAKPKQTAKPNN